MFDNGYYITAELRAKDTSRLEETKRELNKLCNESLKESGCTLFFAHQNATQTDRFVLWERFENEDAFRQHFEEPHTKQYVAKGLTEVVNFHNSNTI